MPGSEHGIPDWSPTIADLLKGQGYVCGQFGKNHLGDRDKHLPTVHGFDEFFGNLYHLNAEEEPETYYYPKDPEFRKKFGPRGVLHAWADGKGGQKIEDTGPLTTKRMETIDDEIHAAAKKFIDKAAKDGKPFFVWFNSTRMHVWTHLKKESYGRTGIGIYPDGMVELDDHGGQAAEAAGRPEDRRQHHRRLLDGQRRRDVLLARWRDDALPRREGHDLGGWVPGAADGALAGRHQARHDLQRHHLPGGLDADPARGGGRATVVEKLKKGYTANGKTFKIHADGYNFLPYFKGEVKKGPREEIYYFSQGGELNAIRVQNWKIHFATQVGNIATGTRSTPGWPILVNLRADPYEKGPNEADLGYLRWYGDNLWTFVPAQGYIKKFLMTIPEFPFQEGSSLNAAGINYTTLKAGAAMKRLHELETLARPGN